MSYEGSIWQCSCSPNISPLRSQSDNNSDYFVPRIRFLVLHCCEGSGPFHLPLDCWLSTVGKICGGTNTTRAGWSRPTISFFTLRCVQGELPPPTAGVALILGLHQHSNTYCLIAVWWLKSFNEIGPDCSGKLPYFCVLNGSDPSAVCSISVSTSLLEALASPSHRALFRAWPVGPQVSAACIPLRTSHHCWWPGCATAWARAGHFQLHSPQPRICRLMWYHVWQVLITDASCSLLELPISPKSACKSNYESWLKRKKMGKGAQTLKGKKSSKNNKYKRRGGMTP